MPFHPKPPNIPSHHQWLPHSPPTPSPKPPVDLATKRSSCTVPPSKPYHHTANTTHRPNFTLTLIRTPKLPPTFATFIVPLNLNKLDIRDYLYHAYGLEVTGVRSYIQLQKLRQDKPGAKRPASRKWFRPRSVKRMTVEMVKPFAWPSELKTDEELEKYVLYSFLPLASI